jgi:hypothetical protein
MEIRIVSYNGMFDGNTGGFSWWVILYTNLLDKKTQSAAMTFENTVQMLHDIHWKGKLRDDQY